jgi:DNA replication and repair protein RecF
VAASRGQQRSIAIALRLAEVALSAGRTGDAPVLLLDDILSELDAGRRERVLSVAFGVDQVLITSPDEDRPAAAELPGATRYRLADGQLTPLA